MKREGVRFTNVTAPGSQTAVSLAALFSGLYFSEERWAPYGTGRSRHPYPAGAPSPRFPELLSARGVATVDVPSLLFLRGDYGVARGFREETVLGMSSRGASGEALTRALVDRLERVGDEPTFLFAHYLEPHSPYGVARTPGPGSPFERYLSMVAVADGYLDRLLRRLEERCGERWILFVSADHGEAFGEHGTTEHGKTLYQELLRVPLLAYGPALSAHVVDAPVGLIDLGPTVLDLFGIATPAAMNGESLVPTLSGKAAHLARPLLAEGRLKRALLLPGGVKVVEDLRRKTVEVYDLAIDPHETRNLWDGDPIRSDHALAELRRFFAVHTLTEGGYTLPYDR
jgi:hypothetical protein